MNAELLLQKERIIFLAGEVTLEEVVPLVHAVDLMLVVTLTRALRQVSLSPLAVTGCDLSCAFNGVFTIVTFLVINLTSFTVITGSTKGKLILIVESTSLITTVKVTLHTFGIGSEFLNPCVL